jgi:multiple sugar transport system substrate-binding protein
MVDGFEQQHIIAVDLPWIDEFAEKGVLMPLDTCLEIDRLAPPGFHTAGWTATHWGGRPCGEPIQTTPELLVYRKDLFAEAGLAAPDITDMLIEAARHFHNLRRGRYGIGWNAARGTALGHLFLMTYSPPDILSMFWYERVRPYAFGKIIRAASCPAQSGNSQCHWLLQNHLVRPVIDTSCQN